MAGVKQHAVSDQEWHESIEALLPLNNVKFGGTTEGPDLTSVKVDSFKLKDDGNHETIVVEYVFDEEIEGVIDATYASNFLLFLKDGTKLVGTGIQKERKESVTVTFDVYWSGTTVTSGNTSTTLRRFGGLIDRDDIAVAAVQPGAVIDGKNKNPMNAVDVRTKLAANGLQHAEVNFSKGIITFTFNHRVEGIIHKTDVENYFALVADTGKTTNFGALQNAPKKIGIDVKTVTVELSKNSFEHSQALIELVGVAIVDWIVASDERERIVPGFVAVQRTYNAGETYAPMLKDVESEYDAHDELLTIQFHFSMKVKETSDAAQRFKLYDATVTKFPRQLTLWMWMTRP